MQREGVRAGGRREVAAGSDSGVRLRVGAQGHGRLRCYWNLCVNPLPPPLSPCIAFVPQAMQSQMLQGGATLEDVPAFRAILV